MRFVIGLALVTLVTACGSAPVRDSASSAPAAITHGLILHVAALAGDGSTPSALEIVDESGHVVHRIADAGYDPAVSPNGELLAWRGTTGIVVARLDGSDRHVLGVNASFVWSPDSQFLLTTDGATLLSVSAITGAIRQVAGPSDGGFEPVAWLDSGQVLYIGSEVGEYPTDVTDRLYIATESGAGPRVLYDSGGGTLTADPSPNGKWVGISTITPGEEYPPYEMVNVATGQATTTSGDYGSITWAPDSSRFAVSTPFGPIEVVSPTGRTLKTIAEVSYDPVAWTAHAIYFVPGAGRLGGEQPQKLLGISAGQHKLHVVLTRRNEQILSVQSF